MTAPIGCREAVQRLWDYLDRDLTPLDEQALEEHLAFCRRCCGELEFARRLRGMLRARTSVELPPDVHERLASVIDDLGSQPTDTRQQP
jgi:anti-sigma factor (TIGR02949 family)